MSRGNDISLVYGFHEYSEPPGGFADEPELHRFAVIFLPGEFPEIDWKYCHSFYMKLLAAVSQAMEVSDVFIFTESGVASALDEFARTGPEDAPCSACLKKNGRTVCIAETEFWAYCGGPPPYSDSYTVSFYTRKDLGAVFKKICHDIVRQSGGKISAEYLASPHPIRLSRLEKLVGRLKRFFLSRR